MKIRYSKLSAWEYHPVLLLLILVSFLFINGCGGASNTISPAGAVFGNILECYVYVPARGMEIESNSKGAPPGYIPLSGARVTVVGQNKYSLTDSSGYAQIKDVLAGTYSVTISKDGYQPITYSNITVSDTSITTVGDSRTGVQTQTSSNPAIADLSSTSGLEDSSLTITGYSFGSVQGTSTVAFYNNKTATVTSWSNTQIVCIVPSGAETGNIKVTVGGNSSNEISFTVLPPNNPVITYINPSSGNIGDSVTITGSNFGDTQGTSTVTFNGTTATSITSWSENQIVCAVPSAATTGNVIVTVGGIDSNVGTFTVFPHIDSLSASSGNAGASVTITGTGFGVTQGSSTVKFYNNRTASITGWSNTSITCTVPTNAETGNITVTVGGNASNGSSFTLLPKIDSLDPSSGSTGVSVTINGSGFGSSQGDSVVKFYNNKIASITSWGINQIICTVPTGTETGNVTVTVGGNDSNGMSFTATHTVTYNGNGNSGGSAPTDSNNYQQGATVTVLDNTGSLVKINVGGVSYRFVGWNTQADGGGTDRAAGSTFAMGTSNVTLYAKWTAYALRDTGPAGGLICYIAADYSAGWRYLEAAPASTEWTSKPWGPDGITGATAEAIGSGQANTTTIIENLGAGSTYAAQVCDALTYGGYSDWFLPSRYELDKMYTELYLYGVGGFAAVTYWSSTEGTGFYIWYARNQDFSNGNQGLGEKYRTTYRTRALRAF